MQYSIVPNLIATEKIKLLKLDLIPVNLCDISKAKRYSPPFQNPFLIINLFAKKTTKPVEIVEISLDELKQFGFSIFSFKKRGGTGWFWGQKKRFSIELKSSHPIGSKKLNYIPNSHHIEYDKNNRCVRLSGPNTSPHGFTKWGEIQK